MYLNEGNNKNNIDREFENKKSSLFGLLFNKKIFLIIGGIGVLIIIGILLMSKGKKTEFFLVLNGLDDMTIYQNSVFTEPGYVLYDNKGNDYTKEVIITGNVNTSIAGEYIIKYTFNGIEKERVVTVIGEINQITYLNLIGGQVIYLKVNDNYQEPGYLVLDTVEDNLQDKVKIEGKVNTQKAGTYKLVYSVINNSGVTITAERTVIVMDAEINVSYSPMEVTNQDVVITIKVDANYFDYVLLPDGTRSINRLTEYKVSKNDNYIFKIYDKDGSFKSTDLTINNIDNEFPAGKCTATYNGNKTIIKVDANDNLGIGSYNYIINGDSKVNILQDKYEFAGNGTSVKVDVKDKAGNVNSLVCSYKNIVSSSSQNSSTDSSSLYSMTVVQQPNVEFPCHLDVATHNQKLADKVKKYGYKTRAGVVAAATYLTKDLGYKIGYWWAGKYDKVGLNSEWGCPKKEWDESNTTGPFAYGTVHPFGLDCTGYIKWAFVNAGFDADLIPRGDMSYYYGTVMPKVVTFANAGNEINNIKPGDLLWKPGHYVVVVAVSDTQLKIAQSVYTGIREDLVDKKTGKQLTNSGQFEKIVLLEEFFQKYGN